MIRKLAQYLKPVQELAGLATERDHCFGIIN